MPVARCKLTNVWPCSHDGVKTLYQQGVRRAAGDYVGTNLIDGHIRSSRMRIAASLVIASVPT